MPNRLTQDFGEKQDKLRRQSRTRRTASNAGRRLRGKPSLTGGVQSSTPSASKPSSTSKASKASSTSKASTATAERGAASNTGRTAGRKASTTSRAGKIGERVRGVGKAAKATEAGSSVSKGGLVRKASKVGSKRLAPVTLALTALETYNTPTSEFSKLTGIEPSDAGSADNSTLEDIGGLATDFVNRGLGALYQLGENTLVVPAIDALPLTNLPRFEQGEYVPGDQVDEYTITGALSGINDMYRDFMGYDDQGDAGEQTAPAQDAQGDDEQTDEQTAGRIKQAARDGRQAQSIASPRGAGGMAGTQDTGRMDDPRGAQFGAQPQYGVQQPRGASGRDGISVSGGGDASRSYRQTLDFANNLSRRREKAQDRDILSGIKRERSRDIDARRDQLRELRAQAMTMVGSIDEQRALKGLQILNTLSQTNERSGPREMPADDLGTSTAAEQSVASSNAAIKRTQAEQAQQQQRILERIEQISKTNPAQAKALARQYALLSGSGGGDAQRYVEAEQVITQGPNGQPLLEPVTAQVTFDTQTGRRYGGVSVNSNAGNAAPPKQVWVQAAANDPRNAGVDIATIRAAYDAKYGS